MADENKTFHNQQRTERDDITTTTHNDDDHREPFTPVAWRRPTYTQDWPAYDAAKTNEDQLFKQLLEELLLIAVELEPPKSTGRPGFDRRTKLFAMAMKTYYRSDLRKATSILKTLQRSPAFGAVPSYKSVHNFFNDPTLGPLLDHLILLTALPMAEVERTAAIDSTGFSLSRYESWQEHKWGTPTKRTRCFRKLHAVIGCKTNIFVSASVTEKNVADVRMLPSVVSDHPKYFDFRDFVADKAYSSREVFKFLDALGLDAFIPFKRGSSSNAKGAPLWKAMYTFFRTNPDAFQLRYHLRSNVETSFHMLKS